MTGLSYAVVGCGRSGSMLTAHLAGMGVCHLTLVDGDRIELHNLGEMEGVRTRDQRTPKADALRDAVLRSRAMESLTSIPVSVTHDSSLRTLQHSSVIFSCVDNDAARLACSIIASLYLKPHVDVATGILGHGSQRRMGADIRLTLPGRCMGCLGGVHDRTATIEVLGSAEQENLLFNNRDWRQERAGSLASLNRLAVSLAARVLEDLVGERIEESTWLHVEFSPDGHFNATYPQERANRREHEPCPLCELSGLGDDGLSRIRHLISDLTLQLSQGTHPPTRRTNQALADMSANRRGSSSKPVN